MDETHPLEDCIVLATKVHGWTHPLEDHIALATKVHGLIILKTKEEETKKLCYFIQSQDHENNLTSCNNRVQLLHKQ
jgi:hypothetical protein